MKKSFYGILACAALSSCIGSQGMHSSKEELEKIRLDHLTKRAALELECPIEDIKTDTLESHFVLEMNGTGSTKHMASGCDKKQIYNVTCVDKVNIGQAYAAVFSLGIVTPSNYECTVNKEAS